MPFPIYNCPLLVRIELFKHFEFQETFMLSLCSENMKQLVQRIRFRPKKVQYSREDNELKVSVRFTDSGYMTQAVRMVRAFYIPSEKRNPSKLAGEDIDCRFIKTAPDSEFSVILQYIEDDEGDVLKLLQNHLESLFRNKPQIKWDNFSAIKLC
ncbi:hypothetical protein CRE_12273 [Caenorhabditis remanei]|uniref:Uncharacterized protein n=1 Tax=Caenorhabditis remanei TaxID=31234 RepID=E3NBC2_CAERE|nr:hypothetical protein CRE_12273 [Caenorhabditis remanei]